MLIVALEQGGGIVALEPRTFEIELRLQDLLRDYPRLLLAPVGEYADRLIWTIGYDVPTDANYRRRLTCTACRILLLFASWVWPWLR